MTTPLESFAGSVGGSGEDAVTCVGGRTHWDVGGELRTPVREVSAPAGVVAHEPGEMIVRVRAGTTIDELATAVAAGGQQVALEADDPEHATVGGVLAVGRSGVRRLGRGPVRDSVLEVTAVTAAGQLVRAGAPLVKNVTGFDLCRLLVGSMGTLALTAEVVLRCHPRPPAERWWRSRNPADPFLLYQALYRPLSILWDGTSTWVGLAGHPADLDDQADSVLGSGFEETEGPPGLPGPARRSLAPRSLKELPRRIPPGSCWMAEIGVGLVHCDKTAAAAVPVRPAADGVVALHRRIKERFDPYGRMNPGRSPLHAGAGT